jgi:hypothetical protein
LQAWVCSSQNLPAPQALALLGSQYFGLGIVQPPMTTASRTPGMTRGRRHELLGGLKAAPF